MGIVRLGPQCLEAEMTVLGAILQDNNALQKCLELLSAEDFFNYGNGQIFEAAVQLLKSNQPADLVTVTNSLRTKGKLEEVGGASYLTSLILAVSTVANVTHHARIVREKAETRRMAELALELYRATSSDNGWRETLTRLAEFKGTLSIGTKGQRPPDLSTAVVEYSDLLTLEIPPRIGHVSWLKEGSIILAHGDRGVGKTFFGLGLAASLVTGDPFLRWPVSGPVGCLYIDGEMQIDELRARAKALLSTPPKAPLIFLTSELVYHRLNRDLLLTPGAAREEVVRLLDQHPGIRVVIFDNISTLFFGIDEDRKLPWEPIASWLIQLRHRRLASVMIHHSGKSGQQRGTSGREDSLDAVIQLERPPGYNPHDGCHFELRFTKSRSVKGDEVTPLDVTLAEKEGTLRWIYKSLEESKLDQVKRLIAEGMTSRTEIAEELRITKGYASKLYHRARVEGGQQ